MIGGDFILVHGDVVANISLDAALAKHRARREANRDACMTVVLREIGDMPHRAAEARVITPVFVVEPDTGRCLQYEEQHPLQGNKYTDLDPSVFDHAEFELRSDVIDCGIDICTPDVLALWSESFDYELPRKNFLHGVLKDWELNGKLIYTEIVEQGYAARASSLRMYDCISKDILERWTLPFVPDSNLVHDQTYKRVKDGSYLEDHVTLERGARAVGSTLGRGTTVGSKSTVKKSVVGRKCKIGNNVRIENSYIWDDAVIEDDSTIIHSILGTGVTVGKGSRIPEGSLISNGVRIGEGVQLSQDPTPRISLVAADGTPAKTDTSLVGKDGKGAAYETITADEDSDSEEEEDGDPAPLENTLFYTLASLNISSESISTMASEDEYDSDEDDLHAGPAQARANTRSRLSSFASYDSADHASKAHEFHDDAVRGLVDALGPHGSDDFDSAKLEFMGLRLSNNASDSMMRRAIAVAFVESACDLLKPELGGLEPTKAAARVFTSKQGAVKFIKEVGVGGDDKALQKEFALAVQKALTGPVGKKELDVGKAGSLLAALLQQLYNLDVLEEEGILDWWADKRASENETLTKIKEKCRVLVEWLEEADEEDGDDDDSDDDDE